MKDFENPYKSEGSVQLKIEKLSQFAQDGPFSHRQSDVIYVRGLSWNIIAHNGQQVGLKQKVLGYYLGCITGNEGSEWSCICSATLKVLTQKDGKEDYVHHFRRDFNAKHYSHFHQLMTFDTLMNPENGWYDEATDSITLHAHIAADAPNGVKNMPDDVYTEYTMRSEYSLCVELKEGISPNNSQYSTYLPIEDKLWSFTFINASDIQTLNLEMSMDESDDSKTIAECIFWYWNDKDFSILQKRVHTFIGEARVNNAESGMKFARISVSTNGSIPVNMKFSVVIRLLDERIASANNSLDLESYYDHYEGFKTVTLCIAGINEASFIVPKHYLMLVSPVFQRMFVNEMTEKATGEVEIKIEDTNAEEFGDFLKAISPKQELPNPSNVFALLKLADRYQIQSLRDRCELHLMNCIEIPMIHRATCSKFYGLNKLKNNLMVSINGTSFFKLFKQTEPHLGIFNGLARKRKHT